MQRKHLVDLTTDRRPKFSSGTVLLGSLAVAEERLEARKDGSEHADHPNRDSQPQIDSPSYRRKDAGPNEAREDHDGDAEPDIGLGKAACQVVMSL
jgi:hypothetical protein